ncbi:hypothetical protein [Ovoidimarina sediminis]|uniref:hypothetical protein n=1 Tax=Ovoidimarina sediminis TaxID=3079856 RepID=UPI002915B22E|nr:hypothetical protein [Rhodophyticola sp. MJ-SS7]MDU8943546.1 hypothetical protein [Rhodophyticola sp. MJ-SS7]
MAAPLLPEIMIGGGVQIVDLDQLSFRTREAQAGGNRKTTWTVSFVPHPGHRAGSEKRPLSAKAVIPSMTPDSNSISDRLAQWAGHLSGLYGVTREPGG